MKTAQAEAKALEAKKSRYCPKCGEECIENTQFLMWCPNCGTEPWEKKTEQPK